MIFRSDLHIHSTLSPCGSLYSSPGAIVNEALRKKMDIIAITDHNSTMNLPALAKAAEGRITAFYGIEVQTLSETHLIAIFDSLDKAMDFGSIVSDHLPEIQNSPDYFGDQVIVDENEKIVAFEERLLLQSVTMDMDTVINHVHSRDGLVFPSHIDRNTYSIISQLGFIPEDLPVDGIEFSGNISLREAEKRFPDYYRRYPIIRNSDAHYLEDVGSVFTCFVMEKATISELSLALRNEQGRSSSFDA